MGLVTKEQERDFEKKHISRHKSRYLLTDVIERVVDDAGYAAKLALIEEFVEQNYRGAPILDLGANTAGEAEVLAHRGYPIVATDINEVALAISRQRAVDHGRPGPEYFAADAHRLPFEDGTFGSIIAFEVLHHFEELDVVLAELFRVLAPGGRMYLYEPYALNPYRRFAELRFVLMGAIERSFTVAGLHRQLVGAGFRVVQSERNVLPPSEWKKVGATPLRIWLREAYYRVSKRFLGIFGNVVMVAEKPGAWSDAMPGIASIGTSLRCPVSRTPLVEDSEGYVAGTGERAVRYPIRDGIPILIAEDGESSGALREG